MVTLWMLSLMIRQNKFFAFFRQCLRSKSVNVDHESGRYFGFRPDSVLLFPILLNKITKPNKSEKILKRIPIEDHGCIFGCSVAVAA